MFIFNHLCGVILLIRGRGIFKGNGTGPLLVSPAPISFLSGVDPESGIIVEKGHPLQGDMYLGNSARISRTARVQPSDRMCSMR